MPQIKLFLQRGFVLLVILLHCSLSFAENEAPTQIDWNWTGQTRDSVYFTQTRHYSVGSNFVVVAPKLELNTLPQNSSEISSELCVNKGEEIVVAEIRRIETDSADCKTFWLKIARDQQTQGWVNESQFTQATIPSDPISQIIYNLRKSAPWCFLLACVLLSLLYYLQHRVPKGESYPFVHLQNIDSVWPVLLVQLNALIGLWYNMLVTYSPAVWDSYYHSPNLTPFQWPFVVALWLIMLWLLPILYIASLDDAAHQMNPAQTLKYSLSLIGVGVGVTILFAWLPSVWLAWALLLVYCWWGWKRWKKRIRYKYVCGGCGRRLQHLGECPRCGKNNVLTNSK